MSKSPNADDRELAELALQLGRVAYADCCAGGLTHGQSAALRFFARSNRFSRTVSAFADYHATTRATASQTVSTLVDRGYLTRHRSQRDGRSTRFDLTRRSRKLLKEDPFEAVVAVAQQLSPSKRGTTARCLRTMLTELAAVSGRTLFGFCPMCQHLQILKAQTQKSYACGLLGERLKTEEVSQICARFLPKAG
jgi:DNA-binding MarR family transcriptional regulator